MKTIIQIHKEDKYFVAVDLITNLADQGLTETEAVANLKKGLVEHYQILMELAPKICGMKKKIACYSSKSLRISYRNIDLDYETSEDRKRGISLKIKMMSNYQRSPVSLYPSFPVE